MYNFHKKSLQQQQPVPCGVDQYYANEEKGAQHPAFLHSSQGDDTSDNDSTSPSSQTSQERSDEEYNDSDLHDPVYRANNGAFESPGSIEEEYDNRQNNSPNSLSHPQVAGVQTPAPHRSRREAQILADYNLPATDAAESDVLAYYRRLIKSHNVTPPRSWREIRFDLPASINELRLFPPHPETIQSKQPSPCLVLLLEGMLPEGMTSSAYAVQMVEYLFELMKYQNASTAMTTLRFVKKGSTLLQLVVTFAKDARLASRILEQLQAVGYPAGFGPVIYDYPANATFEITDYKLRMHDGKGISEADIIELLNPFRQSGTGDINVIEGYEPGVFYAPVKRPETVYSFLWNPFCSFMFQSALFERYGVLVTMALCPHEFLKKGIPYYIQKREKEKEQARRLRGRLQGNGNDISEHHYGGEIGSQDGNHDDDDDILRNDDDDDDDDNADVDALSSTTSRASGRTGNQPPWTMHAEDELDIFDEADITFGTQKQHPKGNQLPYNLQLDSSPSGINLPGTGDEPHSTQADGLVLIDDVEEKQLDHLLHSLHTAANANNTEHDATAEAYAMHEQPLPPPPSYLQPLYHQPHPYPGEYQEQLQPPAVPLSPYGGIYEDITDNRGHNYANHDRAYSGHPLGWLNSQEASAALLTVPSVWSPEEQGPINSGSKQPGPYSDFPPLVEDDDDDEDIQRDPDSAHTQHSPSGVQRNAGADAPPLPFGAGGRGYYGAYAGIAPQRATDTGPGFPTATNLHGEGTDTDKGSVDNGLLQTGPYLPPQPMAPWNMAFPSNVKQSNLDTYAYQDGSYAYNVGGTYYANNVDSATSVGQYDYYYSPPSILPTATTLAPPQGSEEVRNRMSNYGGVGDAYYNVYNYQLPHGLENSGGVICPDNSRKDVHSSMLPTPCGPPPPPQAIEAQLNQQNGSNRQLHLCSYPAYGQAFDNNSGQLPYREENMKGNFIEFDCFRPPALYSDDADKLVATVEKYVRASFPAQVALLGPHTVLPTHSGGSNPEGGVDSETSVDKARVMEKGGIVARVPITAHVPPATAEIEELISVLEVEHEHVVRLLDSAAEPPLATARARLMAVLMVAPLEEQRSQDWALVETLSDEVLRDKQGPSTEGNNSKDADVLVKQLPALLPYLLNTHKGTQLAALLTMHNPEAFLPLLARYVLPFLLDARVVQWVCIPALRVDPSRNNPLVTCVLQHWTQLSQWFNDHVTMRSRKEARLPGAQQGRSSSPAASPPARAAAKRLISQVGNTIDSILAVMSTEQRQACADWSTRSGSVHEFAKGILHLSGNNAPSPPTTQEKETSEPEGAGKAEDADVVCKKTLSELWGLHGAVLRTILRLYLNANFINGTELAQTLFEKPLDFEESPGLKPQQTTLPRTTVRILRPLSRDSLYFIILALSKCHTSPTLSTQTAAFCGRFLRLMEIARAELIASSGSDLHGSPETGGDTLGEKEAIQLFDAAMRSLASQEVYQTMRAAYLFDSCSDENAAYEVKGDDAATTLGDPSPPHFPELFSKLCKPTPPVLSPQQQHPAPSYANSANHPYDINFFAHKAHDQNEIPSVLGEAPYASLHGSATDEGGEEQRPLASLVGMASPLLGNHKWEAALKSYPVSGEPFTPLPAGWQSFLSRSYGHYYFKPPLKEDGSPGGSPSYRHPTDDTEFVATPQAFLLDAGDTTTLKDVVNRANELKKKIIREQIVKQKQTVDDSASSNSNLKGIEEGAVSREPKKRDELPAKPIPLVGFAPIATHEVDAWMSDQRVRHHFLDAAVLDLLSITYRVGGSGIEKNQKTALSDTAFFSFTPAAMVPKTPAELSARLQCIRRPQYPALGIPFSELYRGWSQNMSSSNGLYVFWPPRAGSQSTFQHPRTQRPYRVSPQEFVRHRMLGTNSSNSNDKVDISIEAIAQKAGIASVEVEEWMTDQCYRSAAIDFAVTNLLGIQYGYVVEIDDPKSVPGRTHRRPRDERSKERGPANEHADRHHRRRG